MVQGWWHKLYSTIVGPAKHKHSSSWNAFVILEFLPSAMDVKVLDTAFCGTPIWLLILILILELNFNPSYWTINVGILSSISALKFKS